MESRDQALPEPTTEKQQSSGSRASAQCSGAVRGKERSHLVEEAGSRRLGKLLGDPVFAAHPAAEALPELRFERAERHMAPVGGSIHVVAGIVAAQPWRHEEWRPGAGPVVQRHLQDRPVTRARPLDERRHDRDRGTQAAGDVGDRKVRHPQIGGEQAGIGLVVQIVARPLGGLPAAWIAADRTVDEMRVPPDHGGAVDSQRPGGRRSEALDAHVGGREQLLEAGPAGVIAQVQRDDPFVLVRLTAPGDLAASDPPAATRP